MNTAPWVFIAQAILQAGIEALFLAYIAAYLHARKARFLEKLFISFTLVLCIVHIIDFHLVRLMDLSIWYSVDFILDESWRNFVELLIASTVPFSKIFLGLFLLSLGLIAVIWFFSKSQKIFMKKRRWEKAFKPGRVIALGVLTLGIWEYAAMQSLTPEAYDRFAKALPWKRGLLFHTKAQELECSLKPAMSPQLMGEKLSEQFIEPKQKPNVFLFVIETLREEYLTEETAPHLTAFRQPQRPTTYSSSNATQDSWFSIFYSQAPIYYGDMHSAEWKGGSPILEQFKKAGYKLHLYSGSRLTYYGMNDVIFGSEYSLVDDVYLDLPSRDRPSWLCDQTMMKHLCDDIDKYKTEDGHLFIVFMEATHFDYSWPAYQESRFTPYTSDINFFKEACFQTNLFEIQNRYRNAIHFVDKLLGQFFETLHKVNRFDTSLIAITADHGEEFFEHGNLFHASALSQEQIRVPIYMHLRGLPLQGKILSHVDIMPTLTHCVFGDELGRGVFYGKSAFKNTPSVAMSGRYNGSRSPHEFILQNDKVSLHARFDNPARPARSKKIKILSYQNEENPSQEVTFEHLSEVFGSAFTDIFK